MFIISVCVHKSSEWNEKNLPCSVNEWWAKHGMNTHTDRRYTQSTIWDTVTTSEVYCWTDYSIYMNVCESSFCFFEQKKCSSINPQKQSKESWELSTIRENPVKVLQTHGYRKSVCSARGDWELERKTGWTRKTAKSEQTAQHRWTNRTLCVYWRHESSDRISPSKIFGKCRE